MSNAAALLNLLISRGWCASSFVNGGVIEAFKDTDTWSLIGEGAYRVAFLNNEDNLVYKVDVWPHDMGNYVEYRTYLALIDIQDIPDGTRLPIMSQDNVQCGDLLFRVNVMEFIPHLISEDEANSELVRLLGERLKLMDLYTHPFNVRRDDNGMLVPIDLQI